MKLSEHFTLEEMIFSGTAARRGIDNTPPEEAKEELRKLCEDVLEPVRALVNAPVNILSGYRSPELNANIPGSSNTSQHTKGQAADFKVRGYTIQQLFVLISDSGIVFDQMIQEYNSWVHISRSDTPRRQRLYAIRGPDGKTGYTPA